MIYSEEREGVKVRFQDKTSRDIVARIRSRFETFRTDRDNIHPQFRRRTLLEYVDDSNQRFNNYRLKPDWKEEWQANISDISTHSKLMAINAQMMANRRTVTFSPRFSKNLFAKIFASIYENIYYYIDTVERNGEIDDMLALMKAQRDGTILQLESYEDSETKKGVDVRLIPIVEAFPGNIREFNMMRQTEFIWRPLMRYEDFMAAHKGWRDVKLVKRAGNLQPFEKEFFDVSQNLSSDQVEKIIYWNTIDDEFAIVANGVLITEPGLKLSSILKVKKADLRIPIAKGVYEPYDNNFFYGRSLPDLMRDNQDAIDFLFNAMFDKEMLAVMRPLLVGGVNDLTEDVWFPGAIRNVMDVDQIKELGFEGPDMNSFRILKELQDRQNFISVDPTAQGVAPGQRTATEVMRATEAQQLKNSLFNILYGDFQKQKAELRTLTIRNHYIKNDKFKPFIVDNVKLTDGRLGSRNIEITSKLPPRDRFGFSPQLATENAFINEPSEIIKVSEKTLKDFQLEIRIDLEPAITRPIQKAFIRDYVNQNLQVALARPDLINAEALLKKAAEITPGVDWDEVKGNQQQQSLVPGMTEGQVPPLQGAPNIQPQTSPLNLPLE